jgi:hypothetical protein
MKKGEKVRPLRLNPYLGKYVPAPVAAILTDAEKEALEALLHRKQKAVSNRPIRVARMARKVRVSRRAGAAESHEEASRERNDEAEHEPKNRTHAEMWLTGAGLYDRAH